MIGRKRIAVIEKNTRQNLKADRINKKRKKIMDRQKRKTGERCITKTTKRRKKERNGREKENDVR